MLTILCSEVGKGKKRKKKIGLLMKISIGKPAMAIAQVQWASI